MSVVEGGTPATNIIQRVQNILLKPKAEWAVIDGETATLPGLVMGYAIFLAAIPPLAALIGGALLSLMLHNPLGIVAQLIGSVIDWALAVGICVGAAFITDAVAPSLGAAPNRIQALKAFVYSSTAAWVSGALLFIPVLGMLLYIAGVVYSCYLLYLGIIALMKPEADKATGLAVVAIVIQIVLFGIAWWIKIIISFSLAAMFVGGAIAASGVHVSSNGPGGTVTVNGNSVDLGRLTAAANQITANAQAQQNGHGVAAVDPQKLKGLLPDSVAGMPRTEMTASSGGAAGINASNVEAVYSNDTNRITVTVTDLAAMQGFAGMAAAMNVNSDKETATGYEKVSTVNGRLTTEEWDRQSKNGKYGVVVANRFSVEATGNAGSIDDLKAAVAAVGPDRLEGLAHS